MFLRIDGIQSGPFSAEDVARRFRSGELDPRSMSWCDGETRWISLGRRWRPRRTLKRSILGIAIAIVSAACAVAVAESQLEPLPFRLQTGTVLWCLVIALVAVAGFGLHLSWSTTRLAKRRNLVVVASGVIAVAMAMWAIGLAGFSYPILQVRQRAPNATVTYSASVNAIQIRGSLGGKISGQVRGLLDAQPEVTTIFIDSPGGLVEDALTVADIVKSRSLTVRIDGICASACVAIWAASPSRQMTATSRVGIHQLRMTTELPAQLSNTAKARLERQYDQQLRRAGFSETVITSGDETPPSSVYWMNPIEVTSSGVAATILANDGTPVSSSTAKWLWVSGALGPENPVGRLMETIAQHAPTVAVDNAQRMYAALEQHDPTSMREAVQSLYVDTEVFALTRASDAAVAAWAKSVHNVLVGSAEEGSSCRLMSNRNTTSSGRWTALGTSATVALNELLGRVPILAAAHSLPTANSPAVASTLKRAWDEATRHNYSTEVSQWNASEWCGYRLWYFGYALQLPTSQAADAIRYLELASYAHNQRPADPTDIKAWQRYLTAIVEANIGKITNSPFVYFVPSPDAANAATIARVQDQLSSVVAATVLPNNMVAVGGPSSATTAQVLETAFRNAYPGSFKGVVILFIGDRSDEAEVRQAVSPSGAMFEFAEM